MYIAYICLEYLPYYFRKIFTMAWPSLSNKAGVRVHLHWLVS